jgi:hypothetical protein
MQQEASSQGEFALRLVATIGQNEGFVGHLKGGHLMKHHAAGMQMMTADNAFDDLF